MLNLTLGPLALPLPPLLLAAGMALALLALRLLAPPTARQMLANRLWLALALGLLAARALYLLQHADAYAQSPLAMLDLRDGGWQSVAGTVAGLAVLMLAAPPQPAWRKPLLLAAALGVGAWQLGQLALMLDASRHEELPALALTPLPMAAPSAQEPARPGEPASARQSSNPHPLATLLDGRPLVINLWASWCGPCRAEMPMLARAQARERDIRFAFVNQGEAASTVSNWLVRERLALHDVFLDPGSALGPALGSTALPTTLFFAADGRRVGAHVGALNEAALRVQLQALRAR